MEGGGVELATGRGEGAVRGTAGMGVADDEARRRQSSAGDGGAGSGRRGKARPGRGGPATGRGGTLDGWQRKRHVAARDS